MNEQTLPEALAEIDRLCSMVRDLEAKRECKCARVEMTAAHGHWSVIVTAPGSSDERQLAAECMRALATIFVAGVVNSFQQGLEFVEWTSGFSKEKAP